MLSKVIWGSPMTKICIFWGSKMPILGVKNSKNCKTKLYAPKQYFCSKSYLCLHDQNFKICILGKSKMLIWGVKNVKICKRMCLLQMPPQIIFGYPMTKICIFGVKNAHLGGQSFCCFKCPPKSFWGLPWPKFAKFAYLGTRASKMPMGGGGGK